MKMGLLLMVASLTGASATAIIVDTKPAWLSAGLTWGIAIGVVIALLPDIKRRQ